MHLWTFIINWVEMCICFVTIQYPAPWDTVYTYIRMEADRDAPLEQLMGYISCSRAHCQYIAPETVISAATLRLHTHIPTGVCARPGIRTSNRPFPGCPLRHTIKLSLSSHIMTVINIGIIICLYIWLWVPYPVVLLSLKTGLCFRCLWPSQCAVSKTPITNANQVWMT